MLAHRRHRYTARMVAEEAAAKRADGRISLVVVSDFI
jgi:hypothetical protein